VTTFASVGAAVAGRHLGVRVRPAVAPGQDPSEPARRRKSARMGSVGNPADLSEPAATCLREFGNVCRTCHGAALSGWLRPAHVTNRRRGMRRSKWRDGIRAGAVRRSSGQRVMSSHRWSEPPMNPVGRSQETV
jgi:hypothetical protein